MDVCCRRCRTKRCSSVDCRTHRWNISVDSTKFHRCEHGVPHCHRVFPDRPEGVAVNVKKIERAHVAQGNDPTLRSLRDATRRPPRPRSPLPTWIEEVQFNPHLGGRYGQRPRGRTGRGRRARLPHSVWGHTQRWRLFKKDCPPGSVSLPSWTTSTSCADQPGFWRCTASSKKSCGAMHAWRCIMAKHKFGTVVGFAQKA